MSEQFQRGLSTFDTFESGWASEAFNNGAAFGDSVADKVSGAVSDFFDVPDTDTFGNDSDYMNMLGDIGAATGETASGVGDNRYSGISGSILAVSTIRSIICMILTAYPIISGMSLRSRWRRVRKGCTADGI